MDDGEGDDIPDETEEAPDSGELSQPNTWWMRALTGPPVRQQHHAPLPPLPPEPPTTYRPLPAPSLPPPNAPLTRRLRRRNEYEWVRSSETPPLHVGAEALLYVTAAYMTREPCVIANHQLYIEDYRVFAGAPGHVLVRVTGRERGMPVELLLEMPREI